MMQYDDTIERLAKAVASQINTVEGYIEVMDKLNKIKDTNQYAMAMIFYVQQYTNKSIVIEYESGILDKFIGDLTEDSDKNIIENHPKKEFIFKKLLSNKSKKNYKSCQEIQEGKSINESSSK